MKRRLLLLVCFALAAPAQAKSLYWTSFDAQARLDATGRMRVVERQAIVFDGDWNGAERWVALRPAQKLTVHSVTRIENGVAKPLLRGDLEQVDHYEVVDGSKIRWRSRLPTDPEFSLREITYVVDYTVSYVLLRDGRNFHLAHNFSMPERQGQIDKFDVRLELDPVWRGVSSPIVIHRRNVLPGENVTVDVVLAFAGADTPAARNLEARAPKTPRMVERIVLGFFIAGALFLIWRFFRDEVEVGRFGKLDEEVDEQWLREQVLFMPPEVAGAALHGKTGPHAVAAVLARMEREKKIATRVEGKVLHLRRLVDEADLTGYEAQLAKKIFVDSAETDTKRLRRLYRKKGLDLAALIDHGGLRGRLQALRGWRDDSGRQDMKTVIRMSIVAAVLMVLSSILGDLGAMLFYLFLSLFPVVFAHASAAHASGVVAVAWLRLSFAFLFCAPIVLMPVLAYLLDLDLHWVTWVTLAWCSLLVLKFILETAKIEESREKVLLRRRLAHARSWFARQLRSSEPRLRDEWFPYLIAFGLGKNVDRWFRAYGAASHAGGGAGATLSTSSSSGSSSSGGGWSFSGGGGSFGGAGATGSWGTAVAAMAAGVSTVSSGGGSGGSSSSSSSSGGSSGGGGGGGW